MRQADAEERLRQEKVKDKEKEEWERLLELQRRQDEEAKRFLNTSSFKVYCAK